MEYLIFVLLVIILIMLNNVSTRLRTIEEKMQPQKNGKKDIPEAPRVPAAPQSVPQRIATGKRSVFEERSLRVLKSVWNWIYTGQSHPNRRVSGEYAIATTWLIRLGIAILICSAGFFLKYSIDHNLTPPPVRVLAMSATGLLLAAGGIWKHKDKYRPLFIALSGAGFVTLYLSVMTSYKMYHLLPAVPSFILMFAITALSITGALYTKSLLMALIGCIGGYLTPVFVNTGSNNIPGLFLYMAILGAGSCFAAFFRNWPPLNAANFLLYASVGGAALMTHFPHREAALCLIGLLALNYIIMNIQNIFASFKRDMTFWEMIPSIGNIAFFLYYGLRIADKYYASIKLPALLSLFIAVFSAAVLFIMKKKAQIQPQTLTVFLRISFVFALGVTIPLLLEGIWIVAAWSIMACLLAFAAAKLKSNSLLGMSFLLFATVFFREIIESTVFGETFSVYSDALFHRLLSAGIYIASLFTAGYALRKFNRECMIVTQTVSGVFFFLYSTFEIFEFWKNQLVFFRHGGVSVYWSILGLVLLLTGLKKRKKLLRLCGFFLFAATAVKIFFFDLTTLAQLWRIAAFAVIGVVTLTGAVLYIRSRSLFAAKK